MTSGSRAGIAADDLIVAWLVFPAPAAGPVPRAAGCCSSALRAAASRARWSPLGRLRRDRSSSASSLTADRRDAPSSPTPARGRARRRRLRGVGLRWRGRSARAVGRSPPRSPCSRVYGAPVAALGRRDVRRLHQARRHRHLAGAHRPGDGARPQPRRARAVDLRGDARTSTSATAIRSASSCRSGSAPCSTGQDPAWLFQPYMSRARRRCSRSRLWALAAPFVRSPALRAAGRRSSARSRRCSSATRCGAGSRRSLRRALVALLAALALPRRASVGAPARLDRRARGRGRGAARDAQRRAGWSGWLPRWPLVAVAAGARLGAPAAL